MKCSRCQHDNPAVARFCNACGAPMEQACTQCGQVNPSGSRFCNGCGAKLDSSIAPAPQARFVAPHSYTPKHLADKILLSRASLSGERKQVTVLFADLKGSMELLADRDPEEARKILDPVLERMMEAVHRYEGTVNQVMGDGIMALFGAPLAHEDHAVRACYAALRMQDSVKRYAEEVRRSHGAVVKIRVGLNSGEVVVRAIGSDLAMDYTAVGQTTHLAARMEQLAEPGAIVITPETLALAEGYVEVKSLGPVPVKGMSDPLEVYEVTAAGAARTRLQASARRGLTRFVGRDAELEQLRRAQQLAGEGRGQVAAIVGEAGVGKSRLVYELTHSHRVQGWLTLESASVSYAKATSWLPVIELLKGYFKISDRDELREMREKVTGKLLMLDEALKPTLPALLALLDVPVEDAAWSVLDPDQKRQRTLDAVKRLLLREAREQPLLVIFEDLHWIDGETQALLDSLVESLGSARLLLLVSYRPAYRHDWGGKTVYSQLRLDALPAESTEELLEALLGDDAGLQPLKQLLVKRGNPFFLEETMRTLVETKALTGERGRYRLTQPIQSIQVPATVQVMLAARVDRLAPEDKRLLQVAAVIGKDVPLILLQAIADLTEEALRSGLDRLRRAEFIYETGLYPDVEYSFKHALTHDVAYGGLLQERRGELHARIVEAIEKLHADRRAEHIEQLAYHAVRAGLGERASGYLRQAGLKASARAALVDARSWMEQALDILDALPDSAATLTQRFEIRVELRPMLNRLAETQRVLEHLQKAAASADQLQDDRKRGQVYAHLTNAHAQLGELDKAVAAGVRALETAERLGDLRLRIGTRSQLEIAHYRRGEYERVIELATANLAAVPSDRIYDPVYFLGSQPSAIHDRVWMSMSLAQLGRFAAASERAAEAVRLAEPMQQPFPIANANRGMGTVHILQGDWAPARACLERMITVLRTGSDFMLLPDAVASSAWTLAQLGDAAAASDRIGDGRHLGERQVAMGAPGHVAWAYHALGRACVQLERLDDAWQAAKRVIEICANQPGSIAWALHLLGDIATRPERFDATSGEDYYRQSLALAEPRGMRPLIAHSHFGLGKLYRHTGKREQSREHLTRARTMYREMDMTYWVEQAEAGTAELR